MNDLRAHREKLASLLGEWQREFELSRHDYEALFDLGPLACFVLDRNGMIRQSNLAAGQLLETERRRLVRLPLVGFVAGRDRGAFLEHMRRCRVSDEAVATELTLTLRTGLEIPIELTSRAFVTTAGAHRAYHTTAVDLRERRRAELERLRAVEQRRRVEHDHSQVTAANEAKDRFLAMLSHELRTPLTPVMLAISALEADAVLPAPTRERIAMIHRNVVLEARLIDDLLDLTRITQGKLALQPTLVDPRAVIADVVGSLHGESEAARHTVTLDLQSRLHVRGDALRLRQIVWNLLRNSIRFTPEQGHITVATRDTGDGRLSFTVSDSGIGFDADAATLMFEPFAQGMRSVDDGGLGLGLAIAKGLVVAHGGTIAAASDGVGRGAQFTIELPAVQAPADSEAAAPSAAPPTSHAPLRILLVEDHEDTSIALTYVLEHQGYSVIVAASVAEALEAAAANPIDLIVSDLGLPDGSGLDLMRQLQTRKPVHGIALTGYGRQEDVAKTREAGFDRHLTKPVDVATLIATIEDLRREPA